jgi:hypothetical protein
MATVWDLANIYNFCTSIRLQLKPRLLLFPRRFMEHFKVSLFIEKFKSQNSIPCPLSLCVCTRSRDSVGRKPHEGKSSHHLFRCWFFSYWNPYMVQDYWLFSVADSVKPSLSRNFDFYTHVFVCLYHGCSNKMECLESTHIILACLRRRMRVAVCMTMCSVPITSWWE